jgi:AMIN domain
MRRVTRIFLSRSFAAALCASLCGWSPLLFAQKAAPATVRQARVLSKQGAVEIEVESTGTIVPQTQVVSGPDRLVIDFPNALPGKQLSSQSVNQGQVKDLRVGLYQSKPPVTRVVLDLKTAQSFQIFPQGRTVLIKVTGSPADPATASISEVPAGSPARPALVNTNFTTHLTTTNLTTNSPRVQPPPPPPMRPPLEVYFNDGLLTIKVTKATLSEVLFAVQQRTGAQIAIPAGAEQEKIVADLGPAPASEVLAHLLNGSSFNFLILNAANDPRRLDRVILSPRGEASAMPLAPIQDADNSNGEEPLPDDRPVQAQFEPASGPPPPNVDGPKPRPEPEPPIPSQEVSPD